MSGPKSLLWTDKLSYVNGPTGLVLAAARRHGVPREDPLVKATLDGLVRSRGWPLSEYEAGCIMLGLEAYARESRDLARPLLDRCGLKERPKKPDRVGRTAADCCRALSARSFYPPPGSDPPPPVRTLPGAAFAAVALLCGMEFGIEPDRKLAAGVLDQVLYQRIDSTAGRKLRVTSRRREVWEIAARPGTFTRWPDDIFRPRCPGRAGRPGNQSCHLAGLFLLLSSGPLDRTPPSPEKPDRGVEKSIASALVWFGERSSFAGNNVREASPDKTSYSLYAWFAAETMGARKIATLGGRDWRKEFRETLLEDQSGDGFWDYKFLAPRDEYRDENRVVSTAFALLFLEPGPRKGAAAPTPVKPK